jgi:antitoxin ParD1/3/4
MRNFNNHDSEFDGKLRRKFKLPLIKTEINFEIIPKIGTFEETRNYMSKNTSITLGNYFDQFIQSILREGRYKNVSEAVRAGLRLLEEEEKKITILQKAIDAGIKSGTVKNFDSEKHLKSLKAKKK